MKITEELGLILERLIQAMETDLALPVRIGPKAFGSSMPEYLHTPQEVFVREREDMKETGGRHTRELRKLERLKVERRAKCTRERVTEMEQSFSWVLAHVPDEEHRKALLAYAETKARRWQWERYLENRNRRNPSKKAWVKRSVQRWIILSLQRIADNIPKSELSLLSGGGLPVSHIEAESTGKSIRSDLRSWMSPDGKPSYRRA